MDVVTSASVPPVARHWLRSLLLRFLPERHRKAFIINLIKIHCYVLCAAISSAAGLLLCAARLCATCFCTAGLLRGRHLESNHNSCRTGIGNLIDTRLIKLSVFHLLHQFPRGFLGQRLDFGLMPHLGDGGIEIRNTETALLVSLKTRNFNRLQIIHIQVQPAHLFLSEQFICDIDRPLFFVVPLLSHIHRLVVGFHFGAIVQHSFLPLLFFVRLCITACRLDDHSNQQSQGDRDEKEIANRFSHFDRIYGIKPACQGVDHLIVAAETPQIIQAGSDLMECANQK
nr:MAG TPA: hypothetical protein [Caudoviricetes sp.]